MRLQRSPPPWGGSEVGSTVDGGGGGQKDRKTLVRVEWRRRPPPWSDVVTMATAAAAALNKQRTGKPQTVAFMNRQEKAALSRRSDALNLSVRYSHCFSDRCSAVLEYPPWLFCPDAYRELMTFYDRVTEVRGQPHLLQVNLLPVDALEEGMLLHLRGSATETDVTAAQSQLPFDQRHPTTGGRR